MADDEYFMTFRANFIELSNYGLFSISIDDANILNYEYVLIIRSR